MGELAKFVTAYKEQPPEIRQRLRQKADHLANSPIADNAQMAINSVLLEAMERAEKDLAPAPPVQTVKIELPDISVQTVVRLGKIAGIVGGGIVVVYAIGAAAVGIAASIAAFFAAWGVYLVGAAVGVALLRCVEWGGNSEAETKETPTANHQNIVINVTASNGGNVTVNKETI